MSQQQATVCADDNCVTWAAGESYQPWEVPGHRSTPISFKVFYPFMQTSLETYAHNIGFMTQAEHAAAHWPCPGLSSFLWLSLPVCHFPNIVCSSQLWAERHFRKSHTGQILYSGLAQPGKVTVTFVEKARKRSQLKSTEESICIHINSYIPAANQHWVRTAPAHEGARGRGGEEEEESPAFNFSVVESQGRLLSESSGEEVRPIRSFWLLRPMRHGQLITCLCPQVCYVCANRKRHSLKKLGLQRNSKHSVFTRLPRAT